MVVFSGKNNWDAFIYQFERIAGRCEWALDIKKERLQSFLRLPGDACRRHERVFP